MILLNTENHKNNNKVKKIWLQEEEQLEEEQRKKLAEQQEDADNKGIYGLVTKFNRDNSIEIGKLGSIEFPQDFIFSYFPIK